MKAAALHTLVVVSGDAGTRAVVRTTLAALGNFVVATCGFGLHLLHDSTDLRPDLILLDIAARETDGLLALAQLRQLSASTPIVLIVGTGWQGMASPALPAAVLGVIEGPICPLRLVEQVRLLWELGTLPASPAMRPIEAHEKRAAPATGALDRFARHFHA
jgi:two-component system chemotaxis response regulator CheY